MAQSGGKVPYRFSVRYRDHCGHSRESDVPLIDVRRPIGPNIRADITAARADHLSAERPHQHVIGQPIAAHGRDDMGIGLPSIRNSMPDSPSTSSMPITSMFAGA